MNTPVNRRYLNFPLILLAQTVADPASGLARIACYALVEFAKLHRRDTAAALVQLAYATLRRENEHLPHRIEQILRQPDVAAFVEEVSIRGWGADGFAETSKTILLDHDIRLNSAEEEALINWLALRDAAHFFGRAIVNHESVTMSAAQARRQVDTHMAAFAPLAIGSCPADLFFEFQDGKPDDEAFRLLRTVVAVRSLVGKKDFTGTTKSMLAARMIGAKSPHVAQAMAEHDESLRKEYNALGSRKRFDRILETAAMRGFFTKLGLGRRIYISTRAETPSDLRQMAGSRQVQRAEFRARERRARTTQARRSFEGTSQGTPIGAALRSQVHEVLHHKDIIQDATSLAARVMSSSPTKVLIAWPSAEAEPARTLPPHGACT